MENLLTAHPDINVVYTINEPAAEGAYAAIKKAGKLKDIVLTSIDGGRLGVQYVKDGKIAGTVMQFPKINGRSRCRLRRRLRQDRKEAERVYQYRCDSYYR